MSDDFFYALISGWAILFLFWTIVILFVYIRKPPNSKLTKKTIIFSYCIFLLFCAIVNSTWMFSEKSRINRVCENSYKRILF